MSTAQQQLKEMLDGIAGDFAPIKSGIDAMAANLAAAVANNDPALLQASLDEATDLKTKFDALAASFEKAGSPVPVTSDPAPAPAPADTGDGSAPAASGDGSSTDGGATTGEQNP